jgi:hypothetical protein
MVERQDGDGPDDRDDLLRPTITPSAATTEQPWDPRSQFYVAFFGGLVAVTAIAFLNGRRLRLPASRIRSILLVGGAGLAAALALAAVMPLEDEAGTFVNEGSRNIRLAGRVVAVLACLAFVKLQDAGDRLYRIRGGEYASLWIPGIVAAILGGLVQAGLVFAVVEAR